MCTYLYNDFVSKRLGVFSLFLSATASSFVPAFRWNKPTKRRMNVWKQYEFIGMNSVLFLFCVTHTQHPSGKCEYRDKNGSTNLSNQHQLTSEHETTSQRAVFSKAEIHSQIANLHTNFNLFAFSERTAIARFFQLLWYIYSVILTVVLAATGRHNYFSNDQQSQQWTWRKSMDRKSECLSVGIANWRTINISLLRRNFSRVRELCQGGRNNGDKRRMCGVCVYSVLAPAA